MILLKTIAVEFSENISIVDLIRHISENSYATIKYIGSDLLLFSSNKDLFLKAERENYMSYNSIEEICKQFNIDPTLDVSQMIT